MEWFRSGAMDQHLAKLTQENMTGRYYDTDGYIVDLRPHAFEDYLAASSPGLIAPPLDTTAPSLAVAKQIGADDAQLMIQNAHNERAMELEALANEARASFQTTLASRGGN